MARKIGTDMRAEIHTTGTRAARNGWTAIKFALAALVLSSSYLFAPGAHGAVDLVKCGSSDLLEKYNQTKIKIQTRQKLFYVYNLGVVSLCLGKEDEGLANLQRASDSGHIGATHLLGVYFMANESFDSSQRLRINNQDSFDSAVHYFTTSAQMIESLDNYPGGTTLDMPELEDKVYTSYHIFATIPELYYYGYDKSLKDIVNSQERLFYADTLDVLDKMRGSAERCSQRPSLSAWYEKEEEVYQVQQIRCGAYLNYARAVLPLEVQRIQVAERCEGPLGGCSAHQEIVAEVERIEAMMHEAIRTIPPEYLRR